MKRKASGRSMSASAGVGLGIGVSAAVTLVGAMALAWLVNREQIPQGQVGWGCMLIHILAAASGCTAAWRSIRHNRLPVTTMTVTGYYLLLLMMAMAFGGGFTGMGTTAATVSCGGALTLIPVLFGGSSGARRHKRMAFR